MKNFIIENIRNSKHIKVISVKKKPILVKKIENSTADLYYKEKNISYAKNRVMEYKKYKLDDVVAKKEFVLEQQKLLVKKHPILVLKTLDQEYYYTNFTHSSKVLIFFFYAGFLFKEYINIKNNMLPLRKITKETAEDFDKTLNKVDFEKDKSYIVKSFNEKYKLKNVDDIKLKIINEGQIFDLPEDSSNQIDF